MVESFEVKILDVCGDEVRGRKVWISNLTRRWDAWMFTRQFEIFHAQMEVIETRYSAISMPSRPSRSLRLQHECLIYDL